MKPEEPVADPGKAEHERGIGTSGRCARWPVRGPGMSVDQMLSDRVGNVAVSAVAQPLAGNQANLAEPAQAMAQAGVAVGHGTHLLDRQGGRGQRDSRLLEIRVGAIGVEGGGAQAGERDPGRAVAPCPRKSGDSTDFRRSGQLPRLASKRESSKANAPRAVARKSGAAGRGVEFIECQADTRRTVG